MKKFTLFILLFLFTANFSYADDRTDKPYNIGYAKRYGMVGLYGHLSDYIGKEWGDLSPGGGAFAYYNIFNNTRAITCKNFCIIFCRTVYFSNICSNCFSCIR